MNGNSQPEWQGRTDGTPRMHRALIAACRILPKWMPYSLMALVSVGYIFSGASQRRSIYRYFRRRHGNGRLKAAWNLYRDYVCFGMAVLDRFMLYAGKRFRIDLEGYGHYAALNDSADGFMIFSSHCGNFEMAGYKLTSEGKKFHVVAYGGEAPNVIRNRQRVLSRHNIRQILTSDDLSHLFEINNALAGGDIVSMAADRSLGSRKTLEVPVLDSLAALPAGPFKVAAARSVPVLAVFVNKTGYSRYKVKVLPISDGSLKATELAHAYAGSLSDTARKYPCQWFNFYPFWNDDKDTGK